MLGAATLGVGKIAATLGRGRATAPDDTRAGDLPIPREGPHSQAERTDAVRRAVLDRDGGPFGAEDSKGVFVVDGTRLETMRRDLRDRLGAPDTTDSSDKGTRETWVVGTDPKSTVTYRMFSASGGATIDVNKVGDITARRFHVGEAGR